MTLSERNDEATSQQLLVKIVDAKVTFHSRSFVRPLRISSGLIKEITEVRATVQVRIGNRDAAGHGSVYLGDQWAWPDPTLSHEARDGAMRSMCEDIADLLPRRYGDQAAHPLELGLRLHRDLPTFPHDGMPALARMVCASPFDAAVHDAAGVAMSLSAFQLYEEPFEVPMVDGYFTDGGVSSAIRRMLRSPVRALPAWLVVDKDDMQAHRLLPWIRMGYRCFKIKVAGQDPHVDSRQTADLFHTVHELGVSTPRIVVDANCATASAEIVLEYLHQLRAQSPAAYEALEYLEQPTDRDIDAAGYDWSEVNRLKPVFLDESLTDLDSVVKAHDQGWGGLALKTCKGHSLVMVAAAWAHEHGMALTVQDLTNPGIAAIHSALLAAHLPVVNGVELNSPQYTPEANAEWLPRLAGLFQPKDGVHRLSFPIPPGLGTAL